MSSYSSRSLSKASTCCIRSDHCWSQGRGSPSASFQAGSWTARARADFDKVTPSISKHDALHVVLRLRLGEAKRVDLDAVPEPALALVLRRHNDRESARSHIWAKARSLQVSSMNRTPALTKNEIRPTTSPNRSGGTWPESRTASSTAIAVRHREGKLLHRRRARLLQVIASRC